MNVRDFVLISWRGKASLREAFWGRFFLGQFVVAVALIVLFSPALLFGAKGVEAATFITWPLYFAFLLWALVGIWRCSPNTAYRPLSVAAKAFVALYSMAWLIGLLQGWLYAA